MSSAPPPPPYAQLPTDREIIQTSRRAARQQRRAAALAERQQRSLYRAQLQSVRRTSVLGPVLLISLGGYFLLRQLGYLTWQNSLVWLARWWPLVLIASGAVLLLEWVLDTSRRADGSAARRHIGGGTLTLLLLIAGAGLATASLTDIPFWTGNYAQDGFARSWGLPRLFQTTAEKTLAAPLAAGSTLVIQNAAGNITLTGSSQDGKVHVQATQRLWGWGHGELTRRSDAGTPTLTETHQDLILQTPSQQNSETDLTIQAPHNIAIQIAKNTGDLSIRELRGTVLVTEHQGKADFTAITGDLTLQQQDDNATVTGDSLSGHITLKGRIGDVSLSEVTGPVDLQGDFFGTTELQRINGFVHFHSSFTDLTCAALPGELHIEGRSELSAENLKGPVTIATSNRNLKIEELHGSLSAATTNGSIKVTAAELGGLQLSTTNGTIHTHLPAQSSFHLRAQTTNGLVKNGFQVADGQPAAKADELTTQVGSGGPSLKLHTTNGDILVQKGKQPGNTETD